MIRFLSQSNEHAPSFMRHDHDNSMECCEIWVGVQKGHPNFKSCVLELLNDNDIDNDTDTVRRITIIIITTTCDKEDPIL